MLLFFNHQELTGHFSMFTVIREGSGHSSLFSYFSTIVEKQERKYHISKNFNSQRTCLYKLQVRVNTRFKIFVSKNYDVKYIYFFKLGFKESKMASTNTDNSLEKKNSHRERNTIIIHHHHPFISTS